MTVIYRLKTMKLWIREVFRVTASVIHRWPLYAEVSLSFCAGGQWGFSAGINFLVFLMKESKKRRLKQPGKLPGARPLMNPAGPVNLTVNIRENFWGVVQWPLYTGWPLYTRPLYTGLTVGAFLLPQGWGSVFCKIMRRKKIFTLPMIII